MKDYKMLNKNLLVRPIKDEAKLQNGIMAAQNTRIKNKTTTADVIEKDKSLPIPEGAVVVYPSFAAEPYITDENETLYVVKYEDLMMVSDYGKA